MPDRESIAFAFHMLPVRHEDLLVSALDRKDQVGAFSCTVPLFAV